MQSFDDYNETTLEKLLREPPLQSFNVRAPFFVV
jgi:hypothetical protein